MQLELREAGSKVAVSTEPKCYIDSGICTVSFTEDRLRKASLYLPVGTPTLLFSLGALYEVCLGDYSADVYENSSARAWTEVTHARPLCCARSALAAARFL